MSEFTRLVARGGGSERSGAMQWGGVPSFAGAVDQAPLSDLVPVLHCHAPYSAPFAAGTIMASSRQLIKSTFRETGLSMQSRGEEFSFTSLGIYMSTHLACTSQDHEHVRSRVAHKNGSFKCLSIQV